MATQYLNILTREDIDLLVNLSEVVSAKASIDAQVTGSVGFSTSLPPSIKGALHKSFGLDFDKVPMRWIKGDTLAHKDSGTGAFQNTYLIYLTDSQGELIVDGNSYPITHGTGYVFSEGLSHQTLNTGSDPRLLLGPMSETGFAVGGGIFADGATDTLYIRYDSDLNEKQYKINDGNWSTLYFVANIININSDPASNVLKVIFTTAIPINSINEYFICGSAGIQFGSSSLNTDGSRPVITINVDNYDGLIENGGEATPGQSNIYVYNLIVEASGRTLQIGAGWVGRKGFGNSATGNYIVNCSSTGDLPGGAVGSGGIVGAYAGKGTGAQLTIIGCSSSGSMGQLDGGIVGAYAGQNGGSVKCEQSWTERTIADFAGGIFGDYAGDNGYAEAARCYSTGDIGGNAGGIFGRYAGANSGQANALNCYSRGTIGADGGGIFGLGAASNNGVTRASNCYSSGTAITSGTGIYGSGMGLFAQTVNCYAANGFWSTSIANTNLIGIPSVINGVGSIWVATIINKPYELNNMGYTPYTTTIIDSTPSLILSYSQTITVGDTTITAVIADASGNSFAILQKEGVEESYDTITISEQTGAISTTSATIPGTYLLIIRSTGSYNITTFFLTVLERVSSNENGVIQVPCCAIPLYLKGYDYDIRAEAIAGNTIIADSSPRRAAISYDDINKMKIAKASKRR